MSYDVELNPEAFEAGVYIWESTGTYGVAVGVEVNPVRSLSVQIAIGWEKDRRLVQTNLWIGMHDNLCTIDLVGNQYNEEHPYFHGKGMATCAVNTAIQFLLPFYKTPDVVTIGGDVAYVDDQGYSEEIMLNLAQKRRCFWQRFGFIIGSNDRMSCQLSELKCIPDGLMLDEFPRLIKPELFQKNGENKSLNELFKGRGGNLHITEIIPKSKFIIRPVRNSLNCAAYL
jgi:hypothetical protein